MLSVGPEKSYDGPSMKTQLKMIRGDITTVDAEAIVNSANNDLVLGGGVSGAIRRVAGPAVQDECHKIGTVPLGTAVITTGGQLKAPWIIHEIGRAHV